MKKSRFLSLFLSVLLLLGNIGVFAADTKTVSYHLEEIGATFITYHTDLEVIFDECTLDGKTYIECIDRGAPAVYCVEDNKIVASLYGDTSYVPEEVPYMKVFSFNGKNYVSLTTSLKNNDKTNKDSVFDENGNVIAAFPSPKGYGDGYLGGGLFKKCSSYGDSDVHFYSLKSGITTTAHYTRWTTFGLNGLFAKPEGSSKYYFVNDNAEQTAITAKIASDKYLYDYAGEGLFIYGGFNPDWTYMHTASNSGLINENGEVVFSDSYGVDGISYFYGGVATVAKNAPDFSGWQYALIDTKGNFVVDFSVYDYIAHCNEGLLCVEKNDKYGYIDTKGNVVIPLMYDSADYFDNGVAEVGIKTDKIDKWGENIWNYFYIDKNGNNVSESEKKYSKEYSYEMDSNWKYTGNVIINVTGNVIDVSKDDLNAIIAGETRQYIFAEKDGKWYRLIVDDDGGVKNFTGLTFNSATKTYDGTEKTLTLRGTLPQGAQVIYSNNKGTDVGTYQASATVTCAGYNDLTLNAELKIMPKALSVSGLSANNKTYDGTKNTVLFGGALSGIVAGDDVSATMPTDGLFANANVGTNQTVMFEEIKLNGIKAGNYTLTQPTVKANITKAPLTVAAENIQVIKNTAIPTLTYRITDGQLFGTDTLTGALATRANAAKLGDYDITQGTLKANGNYDLHFIKGTVSVVDKTPQNITVGEISAKQYGDTAFKMEVMPDPVSKLSQFTYISSNENVAAVSADGTVTVKKAGKATITVKEAGNDTYAPFTKDVELTVSPKSITLESLNVKEKTAAFAGVLASDSNVGLDFDKLTTCVTKTEDNQITYKVLNLILKGENAENYILETKETEASETIETTTEVKTTENVTSEIGVTDSIAVVKKLDLTALPEEVKKVKLDFTDLTGKEIQNVTIAKGVFDGLKDRAALGIVLSGDKANETTTVLFDGAVLNALAGLSGENISFEMKKSENVAVNDKQTDTISKLSDAEVYELSLTCDGVSVSDFNGGTVKVTLVYDKYTGGTVKMVCVKDDGTTENVAVVYDNAAKTVTADLKHFSEYAVYTETERHYSGGSGGSTTTYIVKFNTNGGNTIPAASVAKSALCSEPKQPTKNGYTFAGWYLDAALTTPYDFSQKVEKNITLYAKWDKVVDDSEKIILTIGKKEAKVFGQEKINDVAPIIRNDRTMLPARFVAENLGATVEWSEKEEKVTITSADRKTVIVLVIGSDQATVNGEVVKLDSVAFIENDRTYTPVRFIAEALGATVDWIEGNQEVVIVRPGT